MSKPDPRYLCSHYAVLLSVCFCVLGLVSDGYGKGPKPVNAREAYVKQVNASVALWVGKNVNDAVTSLGQPSQTVPLEDGGPHAMIYTFTTTGTSDYYTIPVTSRMSGAAYSYVYSVPVRDRKAFHRSFWVDSTGTIRQWKWIEVDDTRVGNYPPTVSLAGRGASLDTCAKT